MAAEGAGGGGDCAFTATKPTFLRNKSAFAPFFPDFAEAASEAAGGFLHLFTRIKLPLLDANGSIIVIDSFSGPEARHQTRRRIQTSVVAANVNTAAVSGNASFVAKSVINPFSIRWRQQIW